MDNAKYHWVCVFLGCVCVVFLLLSQYNYKIGSFHNVYLIKLIKNTLLIQKKTILRKEKIACRRDILFFFQLNLFSLMILSSPSST